MILNWLWLVQKQYFCQQQSQRDQEKLLSSFQNDVSRLIGFLCRYSPIYKENSTFFTIPLIKKSY
jgi:hypothetical protein